MEKECQGDVKTEYCRVCKNVQHQVRQCTRQMVIKCFHKERQQRGRNKITATSIKMLMGIVWVAIQMPHKISYTKEETNPRGAAGYRLTSEFKRKISGDIREKLSVPFLRHVMQEAINLEKEHGSSLGYSEYKIRRFQYRVDMKLMKYNGLHLMAAGHEEHQYEELNGFIFE